MQHTAHPLDGRAEMFEQHKSSKSQDIQKEKRKRSNHSFYTFPFPSPGSRLKSRSTHLPQVISQCLPNRWNQFRHKCCLSRYRRINIEQRCRHNKYLSRTPCNKNRCQSCKNCGFAMRCDER